MQCYWRCYFNAIIVVAGVERLIGLFVGFFDLRSMNFTKRINSSKLGALIKKGSYVKITVVIVSHFH